MAEYIVEPMNEREEEFLLEWKPKKLIRCVDCKYATNHYQMVNSFICNNRNSPCHTGVVDSDFYCKYGEQS